MTKKWKSLYLPTKKSIYNTYILIITINQLKNYVINEGEIVTRENIEVNVSTSYTTDTNLQTEC